MFDSIPPPTSPHPTRTYCKHRKAPSARWIESLPSRSLTEKEHHSQRHPSTLERSAELVSEFAAERVSQELRHSAASSENKCKHLPPNRIKPGGKFTLRNQVSGAGVFQWWNSAPGSEICVAAADSRRRRHFPQGTLLLLRRLASRARSI